MQKLTQEASSLQPKEFFLFAKKFIDFVREFTDDYHHSKEENVLFTALDEPGVLSHCNPVSQMLIEHDMARNALQQICQAVEQHDFELLKSGIDSYAMILHQHIYKEDNILYPMAEQNITNDTKNLINEQYTNIEQAKNKEILWERYMLLSEQLDNRIQYQFS